MNIGIIGYGSMGSMIAKGLLEKSIIPGNNLFISTRSIDKPQALGMKYAGLTISTDNKETAKNADIVFVCVKPVDTITVIRDIKDSLRGDAHIVSIAGSINIGDIEKVIKSKITRLMPTIASEVYSGVSLTCHNSSVMKEDKTVLNTILGVFGTVREIEESNFGVASELTSCAPGLFSAVFKTWVEESLRFGTLTREESTQMAIQTLYGTAKLLTEQTMSFDEVIHRVATKGGMTEEGAKILFDDLPAVFQKTFAAMGQKRESVTRRLREISFPQEPC